MSPQLHTDEVPIDTGLVSRLVRDQFPDWADLPIERIDSGGTVNAIFRMGTDLAARLPLAEWGVPAIETEFVWSPRLAPHLPLVVPIPICGGVFLNFMMDRTVSYAELPEVGPIQGDPVLDTLIAVLNQLDC